MMINYEGFDFRKPDYPKVFALRAKALQGLRERPSLIPALLAYYKTNPGAFINDWGCTFDPRNAERNLPNIIPFVPFPRQQEWITWLLDRWRQSEDGVTEKSRDMGISWLCIGLSSALCLTHKDLVIGFGSRKEMLVDRAGDPDSLFWKARMFNRLLPPEFRGNQDIEAASTHLKIAFPHTGSVIRGEAGDSIGRGGRSSLYFTDEDAFIPRGQLVDAALSQNTNCRQRVSTVNGMNNPFAVARHGGRVEVFTFHWRDDPRKNDAWYAKQQERLDPVILAQEVDISYTASVAGVLIPAEYVRASIDAHKTLGIDESGIRRGALDVADEGPDKNAYAGRYGVVLNFLQEFSGKGSDIYDTTVTAFEYARFNGHEGFDYDADGLGAGVRGDARVINDKQKQVSSLPFLDVQPFRGSGAVVNPEDPIPMVTGDDDGPRQEARLNGDFFLNAKAQGWWGLRQRFLRTYRAVMAVQRGERVPAIDLDSIISISSDTPKLAQLQVELSQPTYKLNDAGKMVINKTPDGLKSPNLADAVMILFAPREQSHSILNMFNRR